MRALSLLLALLVALVPLSAAEDAEGTDSQSSSSSTSSTSSSSGPSTQPCSQFPAGSQDRQECIREYCADHPQDTSRCTKPSGSQSQTQTSPPSDSCDREAADQQDPRCAKDDEPQDDNETSDQPEAKQLERWCRSDERTDDQVARCKELLQKFRNGDDAEDHWITFRADEANLTLYDLRIAGRLALRSAHFDAGSDNVTLDRVGHTLRIGDDDTELLLHDDPTGLLRFKGDDGALTLVFPVGLTRVPTENGFRLHYASGLDALLLAENATWTGNETVVLTGFAAFHVPARDTVAAEDPPKAVEADERVKDAIERHQVGAEINLKLPEVPAAAALVPDPVDDAQNQSVQVLAYDDVEVKVDYASLADRDAPIRVELSSDLDEGRTIVLHLDADLLNSTDPKDLLLRYYDLHNQTDGSVLETEVVLTEASGLTDILDPSDDGGSPEYWIVKDADGLQVLFSVPHWSAHAITVASLSAAVGAPSVVVGLVVGVAGSVLAATMLLWPRRRDEDEF